jgi:hypothetical protein
MLTRRDCGKGLLGFAALASGPAQSGAQERAIPPQGIGKRFRHLGYSDMGGRPDSVQVMLNRRHLYVGHMFSNGVTILDAADPRRVKPVGFFTGGDYPNASPAGFRRSASARQRGEYRGHAVLRQYSRLFRECAG